MPKQGKIWVYEEVEGLIMVIVININLSFAVDVAIAVSLVEIVKAIKEITRS